MINFDGISKSSAVIFNFWISQGSVAIQLWWGEKTSKVKCILFSTHSVHWLHLFFQLWSEMIRYDTIQ